LKAKSTIIEIDLNTPALEISIVATKKGAPSITRTVTVDDEGDRTVKFSKNLKGYLIKIIVDGETIDKERI
jgi:hypothetical protein